MADIYYRHYTNKAILQYDSSSPKIGGHIHIQVELEENFGTLSFFLLNRLDDRYGYNIQKFECLWSRVSSISLTSTQEVLDCIDRTQANLFHIVNQFNIFGVASWYRLQSLC